VDWPRNHIAGAGKLTGATRKDQAMTECKHCGRHADMTPYEDCGPGGPRFTLPYGQFCSAHCRDAWFQQVAERAAADHAHTLEIFRAAVTIYAGRHRLVEELTPDGAVGRAIQLYNLTEAAFPATEQALSTESTRSTTQESTP
jgi:hypothetical protein